MILYDLGTWHIGFILRFRGATFLKAFVFAVPASLLSGSIRFFYDRDQSTFDYMGIGEYLSESQAWNALNIVTGILLATRSSQSLKRFWDGLTLVQKMTAEWYSAASSLIAFSRNGKDAMMIKDFQHTLIRLVSLLHGSGLHQIDFLDNESFEVIGIDDLDVPTMDFLAHCRAYDVNRVEVILHWIQELVVESTKPEVITVAAPILSRAFQELSRGLVNLNDARKITETPFPFPFAQLIVVLLLAETLIIPFMFAMFVESIAASIIFTFICTLSMWSVNMIAGELEQPFGCDANDLPLNTLQEKFNKSLLVLLDPRAQRTPGLKSPECVEMLNVSMLKTTTMNFNILKRKTPQDLAKDVTSRFSLYRKTIGAVTATISYSSRSRKSKLVQGIAQAIRRLSMVADPNPSQHAPPRRVSTSRSDEMLEGGLENTVEPLVSLHALVQSRLSLQGGVVCEDRRQSLFSNFKAEGETTLQETSAFFTEDELECNENSNRNIPQEAHVAAEIARPNLDKPKSLIESRSCASNLPPIEIGKAEKLRRTGVRTPPSSPRAPRRERAEKSHDSRTPPTTSLHSMQVLNF